MAIILDLLVTWTLKHGHNFKTPCYKDFGTCPWFKTLCYMDFETWPSFKNSMYTLQVYIYNVFLLPYNDIYALHDCEWFTNQCKVYCLVSWPFIRSPKERNVNCHWPCKEPWNYEWGVHDTPPSSLIDSTVNPRWKQWKDKELGYAPWFVALRG